MHRIGKINRRRAAREGNQHALWGKAEDLVLKQFKLCMLKEFFWIVAIAQLLDGLAQPGIGAAVFRHLDRLGAFAAGGILVDRVRCDAVFSENVHVAGADLQLDALARRPNHGGVQRAVVILLGCRDIVFEAARHCLPGRMNDTQRAVTVCGALDIDAKAENV